ncbi:Hypothetical protein HEAR0074 [Herminiimonas arsenicoxydans]|uniref:Uncharacterized protein n=1 Tax=Herminiimonas arsenicoxydans TaxID=204773 RepID=A4G1C3_HERAR|nr:Hypothetical protein HEAR0074 [Herminiimonas arsenicoxydans]
MQVGTPGLHAFLFPAGDFAANMLAAAGCVDKRRQAIVLAPVLIDNSAPAGGMLLVHGCRPQTS